MKRDRRRPATQKSGEKRSIKLMPLICVNNHFLLDGGANYEEIEVGDRHVTRLLSVSLSDAFLRKSETLLSARD